MIAGSTDTDPAWGGIMALCLCVLGFYLHGSAWGGIMAYFCPMEWTFSLDEIRSTARDVLSHYPSTSLFLLDAPMGAGKTTFVAALLKELGVEEPASSPTFSIIQEYRSPNKVIMHMDLYRLKDEEEALQAGVQDAMDRADYTFIEWPFIAEGLFSEDSCVLRLTITEGDKRNLTVRTLAQVQAKLPEQS